MGFAKGEEAEDEDGKEVLRESRDVVCCLKRGVRFNLNWWEEKWRAQEEEEEEDGLVYRGVVGALKMLSRS